MTYRIPASTTVIASNAVELLRAVNTMLRSFRYSWCLSLMVASCSAPFTIAPEDRVALPAPAQSYQQGLLHGCANPYLPGLDGLLQRVDSQDFVFHDAMSRLRAVDALAIQSGLGLRPSLGASIVAAREPRQQPETRMFAQAQDLFDAKHRAAIMANYEIELWQHLSSAEQSRVPVQANVYERDAIVVTLSARVAETWTLLLAERESEFILRRQLEMAQGVRQLIAAGADALSPGLLRQQEYYVREIQGRISTAQSEQRVLAKQLRMLLGEKEPIEEEKNFGRNENLGERNRQALYPSQVYLPSPPLLTKALLPLQRLTRRPDLLRDYRQLQQWDPSSAALLDQVLANHHLRLTASGELEPNIQTLQQNLLAQLPANAALKEFFLTFNTVLREIQLAWRDMQSQQMLAENIQEQIKRSEHELAQLIRDIVRDDTTGTKVLAAQKMLPNLQQQLLSVQRQHYASRIALCRALAAPMGLPVDTLPLNAR